MHGRLSRVEGFMEEKEEEPDATPLDLLQTIGKLRDEQTALRQELQTLKDQVPVDQSSNEYEHTTSAVDSRIDARYRQILSHLQNEILKASRDVHEELNALKSTKADREELTTRFARLASAAMEEQYHQTSSAEVDKEDDFLLPAKNLSPKPQTLPL